MPGKTVEVVAPSAPSFAKGATEVMGGLSQAFAEVLDGLPLPIRRAVDLERALKLDKKLAWQIFKIARATHPAAQAGGKGAWAAGLNVPSRASVSRVATEATRMGAPAAAARRLIEAFDAFEHFVAAHAGDRESFQSMVGALTGEVAGPVDEKHRLANYRSNSHIWGMRADATVRCEIFHPKSGDADELESAVIYGCRNLHRLRRDAHVAIEIGAYDRGRDEQEPGELPVLLKEFSDPINGGQWIPTGLGHMRLELGELGRGAAASFFIQKLNPCRPGAPRLDLENTVAISMPVMVTVVDLMVPVGMSNPSSAKVTVYGSRSRYPYADFTPADVLPHREHVSTVRRVTVPPGPPELPELPRYPEAVSHVLKTLGWDGTAYDVYRCRVVYPFFHTQIRVDVQPTERKEST